MPESLKRESDKLVRSWMQHDSTWLRGYLVAGVEDPRLNLQSILTRHCLIRSITAERFAGLMAQEYRFAAVLNWLMALSARVRDAEELAAVFYALRHGADNAEGTEIPRFAIQAFRSLPAQVDTLGIPNYIESFLTGTEWVEAKPKLHEPSLSTFQLLWSEALSSINPSAKLSVLEPACGSANDYRGFHAYGLGRVIDYTGIDICPKNIENARALFPESRFEVGNVFEIAGPDKAWDICVVSDLFEHLSLEGLAAALKEICRVTRMTICAGFFQMDEIADHVVRPLEEYHWNLLSVARVQELCAQEGFQGQVFHIGTFLRHATGCATTHNPNAYTLVLNAAL